jgi:diadenosine tetraphosphate (Ap4A) HIT family hydrolase
VSDSARPLPAFTGWPTFPFDGDIHVKPLDDPVPLEPARQGENAAQCSACNAPDDRYIWISERWRVRSLDRPTGLPMVLILESRSHLDLGDLPNLLAAELGVMTVRLERAIRSLDGVARVHVNRWGDGAAHLHVWFLARPYGRLQLRGTFLSLWDEILPTVPEAQWRENLAMVAAWLAEFGGRPLAEPPRIDWKAPAKLPVSEAEASPNGSSGSPGETPPGNTEPVVLGGDPDPLDDHPNSLLVAIEGELVDAPAPTDQPKTGTIPVQQDAGRGRLEDAKPAAVAKEAAPDVA